MRMLKHPVHLKFTLPILVLFIVSGGVLLSIYTHDPHCLNRAGAVIAALAAAAVLAQIKAEMKLEEEREHVESQKNTIVQNTQATTFLDEFAKTLEVKRLELHKGHLSSHRLEVAAFVVCSAMLGELLHGFGDLLICFAFAICTSH